ncbi:MAG: type transport system ATP-binding protein [Solirubrobacteraceae bacterium]|nr:type transport system ATP-binding protein [Solirubrobacteraceae bacterium]
MERALPDDIAVRAEGVSKVFRLPHEQVHTLKERVVHPTRRRRFDALQALDDVGFDVRRGEFFGIVGRNGSGKSTLMKCLAGIYRADAGEMWLRGRMAPFIELGVGFNPELTARDNVLINAVMLGLTHARARERYDEIIAFAELEEFVDLKLKNYSSGMHVRLAFSVMVHVDADVLLIDEVLAVGDAAFQQKCYDALNRAHSDGRTILLVTHDMDQVQRFCSRALLLEHGRPVALSDARSVARQYLELNFPTPGTTGAADELAHHGRESGGAEIVDTWFQVDDGRRTDVLETGKGCAACIRVRFLRDATDPVFGIAISDDQRRVLFAVTTEWQQPTTGEFAVGDIVDVAVSFDNWFAPGRYFVTPHVAYPGTGHRAMTRREDAATVVVIGSRTGGGIVDIPHAFHVLPIGVRADAGTSDATAPTGSS